MNVGHGELRVVKEIPRTGKFRPISRKRYDEEMAVLEAKRSALRKEFEHQQVEVIPDLRTLNGYQYKQQDDILLKEIDALEQRLKTTRFIAATGGFDEAKPPEWSPRVIPRLDQPLNQSKKRKPCTTKGCPYPRKFNGKCSLCMAGANVTTSKDFRRDRGASNRR